MPLINCPECQAEVSDNALKCLKCGVQLRKLKRGFFGTLFKWGFIGFNILMVMWLFSYWETVGDFAGTAGSEAENAGTVIGATLGTGVLIGVWVAGCIVLGLFVLFTRPKE